MGRKATKMYFHNIDGFWGTAKDYEDRYGIDRNVFSRRVNQQGWDVPRAVSEGVREITRRTSKFNYTIHGFVGSLPEIAKKYGISYNELLKQSKMFSDSDENIEKIVDRLVAIKDHKETEILANNKNLNDYENELEEKKNSDGILNEFNTKTLIKKNANEIIKANFENNTVYNPILDWCLKNHKDYNVIMKRIANDGMTFEEAREIPMTYVKETNLIYHKNIGSMKHFVNKYKLDFAEVYRLSCELYDFEYIIDTLRKVKNKK